MSIDANEPTERLAERVSEGVAFGIGLLKRLQRKLPRWLRRDGRIDRTRCVAAMAAVETALAHLTEDNLARLARRIRESK